MLNAELARKIMSKNFFGVEEWKKFYGVSFTAKQLQVILNVPWSKKLLAGSCPFIQGKLLSETHILFLGIERLEGKPLVIRRWYEIKFPEYLGSGFQQRGLSPKFLRESWPAITENTCKFGWYLMPIVSVPRTEDRGFEEQVHHQWNDLYRVAFSIEEFTKRILIHHLSGTYGVHNIWSRCQENCVGVKPERFEVGYFDGGDKAGVMYGLYVILGPENNVPGNRDEEWIMQNRHQIDSCNLAVVRHHCR